jgi:ribosome-binding factor A
MASEERAIRVAQVVKAEIADLLSRGLKDPRVGFVSIMEVRMSSDLRYANVHISMYGTDKEMRDSMVGLKNSAGWIRKQLGKKLRLRLTPEVRFFKDTTLENVFHLDDVFKELHETEGDYTTDDETESTEDTD